MTVPRGIPGGLSPNVVAAELDSFIDSRISLIADIDPEVHFAAMRLRAFAIDGGKRIRPRFAWAGWLAGRGSSADDSATRVCASLELIQACALIHDDIIDQSLTRRSRPTVHVEFARLHHDHSWDGGSEDFGRAAAILLGDLALAWADDMFAESGADPAALLRARPVWAAMRTEVLAGQYLDIVSQAGSTDDPEIARQVNVHKTAGYTAARPLEIGARLAGADEDTVRALRQFGLATGSAFQLRDDMLDIYGDPAHTGRRAGEDLRTAKRTVLLTTGLRRAQQADPAAFGRLRSLIGTDLSDAQVSEAGAILREVGATALVEAEIWDLERQADTALAQVELPTEARAVLDGLTDALRGRTG